jgi:EmrB/QacA subfamily drug resistance transporter
MKQAIDSKQRVFTLIGVGMALFLGALDQTIVSTAMPRIVSDLSGIDRYAWVSTIYLLVSTILVPIYGKLSDMASRKRLEMASVSVFLFGSVLCGLSGEFGTLPLLGDGMSQLIVFRGVQGLGGAGVFALAFIVVSDLYPPRERGKVVGIFGAVFGLASILGPLAGGYLTDNAGSWIAGVEGWRWVFYVNVPLGALALWFIGSKMPPLEPAKAGKRVDLVSGALLVLGFVPLILGLSLDKTQNPWDSPQVLGLLIGAAAFIALWVLHSLRSSNPVLDLRLFRNRVFWSGTLSIFFLGASFMAIVIFLPIYMVNVQEVSATGAGVSVIPLSLGMVFGAGLTGALASKTGRYKLMMLIGTGLAVIAFALLSAMGVETSYGAVVALMVLAGAALGPSQSLYTLAVQNSVPADEMGQATSMIQFTRQIGGTIGAAVLGAVFSASIAAAFVQNMGGGGPAAMGGEGMESKGPVEIRAEIAEGFDRARAMVLQAAAAKPEEGAAIIRGLSAMPSLPVAAASSLSSFAELVASGQVAPQAFEGLAAQLERMKVETADRVVGAVRKSFAESVGDVWFIAIFFIAAVFAATTLIPSVPLRGRDEAAALPTAH